VVEALGRVAVCGIDDRALRGGIDGCDRSGRPHSTGLSGVLLILDGSVYASLLGGRLAERLDVVV
jgi:hypothetical protein